MQWCLKNQSNQAHYMFCQIYLNFTEQYSFKVDRGNITLLISSYWIFNSCYLNNKVTCEKFDVLLYATFGRSLDVQISPLPTRLQWTEKGRPMDVQYGTWTDRPNKDVLWVSLDERCPLGGRRIANTSWRRLGRQKIIMLKTSARRLEGVLENQRCLLGRGMLRQRVQY